ncbi:MAG: hypothetical protein RLZZ165_688 [Bacteroidota bacterium]|jgi:tetratricopeptide (TPR) repeat protein
MKQNPVNIRIGGLVGRWNKVRAAQAVRLVRVLYRPDEAEMVDTFYNFLHSEESDNPDIPMIFEREFKDSPAFSRELVLDLHGHVLIWNESRLEDGTFPEPVHWEPDYGLGVKGNDASLFVENLNRLARSLAHDEGRFVVALLKVSFASPKRFCTWLQDALDHGVDQNVRLVIGDETTERHYDAIVARNRGKVVDLPMELGMDSLGGKIAAIGNPHDPAVQYRKALMALIEAVPRQDDKGMGENSDVCLNIALGEAKQDPSWYSQVLVVYSILCNDRLGRKEYKKAIDFAGKAVEEMRKAEIPIAETHISQDLLAQALMSRAAAYRLDKDWANAHRDFAEAVDLYSQLSDAILGMEACRMDAHVLQKAWRSQEACQVLVRGFQLARTISPAVLRRSSFPLLVERLLETPYRQHLPQEELEGFLESVYGPSWHKAISSWKQSATESSPTTISDLAPAPQ